MSSFTGDVDMIHGDNNGDDNDDDNGDDGDNGDDDDAPWRNILSMFPIDFL